MPDLISENERTWDAVADQFVEASALPEWGPFGVGADLGLIPEVAGLTFLEVGCGSGRSIKWLTDHGAAHVYALDVSSVQLAEAERHNRAAVAEGRVTLLKGRMEDRLAIPSVDVIVSVYAIGWTPDPAATFASLHAALKPGGRFIWSWDHTIATDVQYEDGRFAVAYSYHEEKPIAIKDWKGSGHAAHVTYRKNATWFCLLREAGFEVVGYHEPAPVTLAHGSEDPTKHYAIQKARRVPVTVIWECGRG
jgi:SAM-dependent methyltransferase